MTPRLSVLDQSFVKGNDPKAPARALRETIDLARHCEALGYQRFWVSEHHDSRFLAGSSPEVLLSAIGAATSTLRIGSGGVMLPHYSPYKVAENFAVLANLYPGRIDLGLGRAPGGDLHVAQALAGDGRPRFEQFPAMVELLDRYLHDPKARPRISPAVPAPVPLWILGSSADSAMLAAARGLPYCLGLFISPGANTNLIDLYRRRFQPSEGLKEPRAMLAISVICAEDPIKVAALKQANDVNLVQFYGGGASELLPPEQALQVSLSEREKAFLRQFDHSRAVGTPEEVRQQITDLAASCGAGEVMLVCSMWHQEDKWRCFELLAEAFDIR